MQGATLTTVQGVTAGMDPEGTEIKTGTGTTGVMSVTGTMPAGLQIGGMMGPGRVTAQETSGSGRRKKTRYRASLNVIQPLAFHLCPERLPCVHLMLSIGTVIGAVTVVAILPIPPLHMFAFRHLHSCITYFHMCAYRTCIYIRVCITWAELCCNQCTPALPLYMQRLLAGSWHCAEPECISLLM